MTVEGIVRNAESGDQTYRDHTLFSLLRPEWKSGVNEATVAFVGT